MQNDKERIKLFFDESWVQMNGVLDVHFPIKKKGKRRFVWWWLGSGVGICLLAGLALWQNGSDRMASQITDNQMVISATKTHNDEIVSVTSHLFEEDTIANNQIAVKNVVRNDTQEIFYSTPEKQSVFSENHEPSYSKKNSAEVNIKEAILGKESTTVVVKPIEKVDVFLPLKLKKHLCHKKMDPIKPIVTDKKRKGYLLVEAKAFLVNSGLSRGSFGLSYGRYLTPRLSLDAGVGVSINHVLTKDVYTAKAIYLNYSSAQYQSGGSSLLVGENMVGVVIPVHVRYRMLPHIELAVGGGYERIILKRTKDEEDVMSTGASMVTIETPAYIDFWKIGSGVSYIRKRWGIGLGYERWLGVKGVSLFSVGLQYKIGAASGRR